MAILDKDMIESILKSSPLDYQLIYNQKCYYKGKNPGILEPSPKEHPDNRIPVPLARRFVDQTAAFIAMPGTIVYSGEFYSKTLKDIYNQNEEQLKTFSIMKELCKHGIAFEYHWYDPEKGPCFAKLPTDQCYPILSDDLEPELTGLLWKRKIGESDVITFYDSTDITTYEKTKSSDWTLKDQVQHFYGKCPVLCAHGNEDNENVFDHVIAIIDGIDRFMSQDLANESERFSNAYILMANRLSTMKDENGFNEWDKLKMTHGFDGLDPTGTGDVTKKVAFLTKNIQTEFIELCLNTYTQFAYDMASQVNPNNDAFANASGESQRWRMMPFKNFCGERSAYLIRFLQDRIRLIYGLLVNLRKPVQGDPYAVTIKINDNAPYNLADAMNTAASSVGILSKRKTLEILPEQLIGDIDEELDRQEKEKAEYDMDDDEKERKKRQKEVVDDGEV